MYVEPTEVFRTLINIKKYIREIEEKGYCRTQEKDMQALEESEKLLMKVGES